MKFVKEHINFERNINPKTSLNIGEVKIVDEKLKNLLKEDAFDNAIIILSINFYEGEAAEFVCDDLDLEDDSEEAYIKKMLIKYGLDTFFDISKLDNKGYKNGITNIIVPIYNNLQGLIRKRIYLFNPGKGEVEIQIPKGIKENLEFERGKDPKDSMRIGLAGKWLSLKKGDLLRINKRFSTDGLNQIIDDAQGYTPFESGKYLEINNGPTFHKDGNLSFTAYVIFKSFRNPSDVFIWGTPQQFNDKFGRVYKIEEALGFERGRNPKAALGIGQITNIPKILLKQDLISGYGVDGLPGSIRDIKTTKDRVHIRFFYDQKIRNLETNKIIPKERYAQKLAEDAGIWNLFKNFYHAHKVSYEFYYTLKDEYKGILLPNQTYNYKDINESLEFERGKDPKEAINIGRESLIKKEFASMKDAADWAIRNLELITDNKYSPDNVIRKKDGLLMPNDLIDYITDWTKKVRFTKYTGEKDSELDILKSFGLLHEVGKQLKEHGILIENMEFERGKDPKKALGLGNEAYRVAADLGIDMAELRSLWNYISKLEPERETGVDIPDEEDFKAHIWMIWDDPGAWGVDKQSTYYEVIEWAYGHQEEAWRIYNLTKNEVFEIYESLEFERGKDPRETLDIGGWRILKEQIKDLLKLDWNQKRCIKKIEIWKSRKWITLDFRSYTKPPKIYVKKILKETGLLKYLDPIASDSHSVPIVTYSLSYNIKEKYQYMFKPFQFSISYNYGGNHQPEIYEVELNESLEFERGKDPKEALNIGKRRNPAKIHYSGDGSSISISFDGQTEIYYLEEEDDEDINILWDKIEKIASRMGAKYIYDYESEPQKWEIGKFPVNETLDFERGRDPKHSMNIGAVKVLEKKWDELQQAPGTGSMNLKDTGDRLFLDIHFGHFPGSATANIENVEKYLGKQYFDWQNSYQDVPHNFFCIKPKYEDLFIEMYNTKYSDWPVKGRKRIRESLEFERRRDPKSAMGIGMAKDKNGRVIQKGNGVYVEGDLEEDDFSDFEGTVDSFHGEYVTIRDMEDDYFDVEPHKLEILDETLEFERGRDPKKTLGLGKLQQIYKGMSEDNWSHEENINDALQWSSFDGNLENVIYLLELGADPSLEDSTAFMEALKEDHYDIADLFVDKGLVNPKELIKYFKTFTEEYQSEHIVRYLKYRRSKDMSTYNLANESLEFERGRDPKESIGIGQSQILDKKLKEFLILDKKETGQDGYIDKMDIKWYGKSWIMDVYTSNPDLKSYFEILMKKSGLDHYIETLNSIADLFPPRITYHYKIKNQFYNAVERLRENGYYVVESLDFERGKDPKEAMKIGVFHGTLDGYNYIEVAKRIYHILPQILNWNGIPDNILQQEGHYLNYDDEITDYIVDHHSRVTGEHNIIEILGGNPYHVLHQILLDKGFKELPNDASEIWPGDYGTIDESLEFERGKNPKEAMELGSGKLIPENWEHLKRDLQPYLIDYHLDGDLLIFEIDSKFDTEEVITIIEGYLETWAKLEKYSQLFHHPEEDESDHDYTYYFRIKQEFVNIFRKALWGTEYES